MAKTYKVSTVEVSAQSRKEWLARKRGKGEVATSAAAVVVQSEASSAPSALDALFRQVNIGTDYAPKYVAEALFPLRIGDALLDWHADQKYLGVEHATETEKANFFATGGVTAGGIGSSSGGSGEGGSSTLAGLNDVALRSAIADDMLVYNGTHWVNTPMSAIKPDLTDYATKLWVEGKNYITASALDPYAKTADVANTYATKTALQGVDIRVQAIEYIFEKDNDGVINKWSEIVDFLAGVEGTTLDGILEQFMPKAGGTIGPLTVSADTTSQLAVNGTSYDPSIVFQYNGAQRGGIVFREDGPKVFIGTWNNEPALLHTDNYNTYTYSRQETNSLLSGYLPLTGGTLSGLLTIPANNLVIRGSENAGAADRIVNQTYDNGLWGAKDAPEHALWSIRNAFAFDWYNDRWITGVVRYWNATSAGFGIGLIDTKDDGTLYQKNLFRIDKNGEIYQSGVALSAKYMPKTGGEFTNAITISKDISAGGRQLILNGTNAEQVNWNAIISFRRANKELSYIGTSAGTDGLGSLNFVTISGANMCLNEKGLTVNSNVTTNGKLTILHAAPASGYGNQCINIQSESTSDIVGQPGIAFHCPNINRGCMKLTSRGFEFCSNDLASRMNVVAKTFIGNLQGNADSATELQTPRTLWGKSFDGTADVDGDMTIYDGSITIKSRGENASTKEILFVSSDYYNGVKVVAEHANYASRKDLVIYTSNNEVAPYEPKWAQAVRIGYKNDVILAVTKIRVSTPAISSLDATNGSANAWNVNYNAMFESNNNALTITVDGTENVRHAMIQVGHSNGGYAGALGDLYINPFGGNVGIGTTNPTAKLYVEGKTLITDSTTIEQNLFVDKNIYIAESSSNGGIYFGDNEYAYIKETPDDVMTIASNKGLTLSVNHISDEGGVIKLDGPVRIGDAILSWDSTNKCITIKNANTGEKASLLVDGGVTATAIN